MSEKTRPPAIIYGAAALGALSLVWSAYAITDYMGSGPWGLSVAVAGDIGWITVLWAEWRGVTISGRAWTATVAGWLIAIAVGVLLVMHGAASSIGQAIAGPFVVLVGKIVWAFALAAMKDPAALTPEQQAEIDSVIRDSTHKAGLSNARSTATIATIRDQARITMAQDEADFEVWLERIRKQGELQRRTPITLPPATSSSPALPGRERPATERETTEFATAADQAIGVIAEQTNTIASTPSIPNTDREQIANTPLTSPNPPIVTPSPSTPNTDQPSIADLVREQIASTPNNTEATDRVMEILPDANRASVAAAVRRARQKTHQMKGGYA
ncbi:hypothetical protein ACF07T_32815 [Streptomyces sp. NPDC015184]|uniref:hypothetical protein n=1 Tax=Streptomyces sp. NPDC015184 TaxID=3364946 RepID=UPI0036F5A93F